MPRTAQSQPDPLVGRLEEALVQLSAEALHISRPLRPVHCCCLRPKGMLAALWVDIGAPEPRWKDWRAQFELIRGCRKLQADICPDF